jgi:hypothetical protein
MTLRQSMGNREDAYLASAITSHLTPHLERGRDCEALWTCPLPPSMGVPATYVKHGEPPGGGRGQALGGQHHSCP